MGTTDPRIDAYIAKARPFARPLMEKLREAFHKACPGVVETMKWSSPAFEQDGLLGGMAAFKEHVSFSLWRGMEIDDPEGIFEQVGNSTTSWIKIHDKKDLPTQKVLRDYIKRAAKANAAFQGAPKAKRKKKAAAKRKPAATVPPELAAALKKNAKARKTFEAFPPSAKRDYIEWITEAKREATREKRLKTTLEWLAEGKRKNWKYENC